MDLKEKFHLQKLAQGDKDSFVYLHGSYQSKVYHYCHKFVRNREIAEELTSDVFVKLWEKRQRLRDDLCIGGLLLKIARDFCISYLRKVAKNADLRREFIAHYFDSTANPVEEAIYLKEGLRIADKAIDHLPPKCRQVFCLRYRDGWSLGQIAEELHISTNTVQNHLQKGTRLVKVYLRKHSDLVFLLMVCSGPL